MRSRASDTYSIFSAYQDVGETIPRDKYIFDIQGTPFLGDLDVDGKTDFGVAKIDTIEALFKYRISNAIGGLASWDIPGRFNDMEKETTGDDEEPTAFRIEQAPASIANFVLSSGDIAYPVVADYDGDFVADLAVAIVKNGGNAIEWRYRMSIETTTLISLGGGISHSTANAKYPVPGYWDADNRADIMYVVEEGVGAASTKTWNWYGGFSAGVKGNTRSITSQPYANTRWRS